jgi:alanyl-tRNA synthetase
LGGKIVKSGNINNRFEKRRNLIEITENPRLSKEKDIKKEKSKGKENRNNLNNQSLINSYKTKDNKIGPETSKSKDHKSVICTIKNLKKSQNNLQGVSQNNHSQRTRMNNSVNHALQENASINMNHHNLTMVMSGTNGGSSDLASGFATKKTDKTRHKN